MNIKNIETKNDKKDKLSVIEILRDIDYRLTHIEDIQMDNRELIIKLVKQGNTIVEFLRELETSGLDPLELESGVNLPTLPDKGDIPEKTKGLKDLLDDILNRQDDLKDFEEELKKHKNKITPGQAGEA